MQMNIPLLLATLLVCTLHLQLLLRDPHTCLSLEVPNDNDKLLFTYHHNVNLNTANLIINGPDGPLAQSGTGPDYLNFLEVTYPTRGEYDFCFVKEGSDVLEVHFDIIREDEQMIHAGKEDIGKVTRRVGEFLVEIKKTSWEYKEILSQHNSRQLKLQQYERDNLWLYGLKIGVMIAVLGGQAWAVRRIFQ